MTKSTQSNGHGRRWLFWLAIFALSILFFYLIRSILLPFVVGMLSAYFLDPAADRLEELGLKRTAATAVITLTFFILLALAIVMLVPVTLRQGEALITAAPDIVASLQTRFAALDHWLSRVPVGNNTTLHDALNNISDMAIGALGGIVTGIFASGVAVLNVVSLLLITPLVTFYLLRDWDEMKIQIYGLLPVRYAETVQEQMLHVDATLAGFIRGQMNVCFIMGIYYAIFLTLAGLPFGMLLGFIAGALTILPYVGFAVSILTAIVITVVQHGFGEQLIIVLAVFGGAQILESYFLTPRLVGSRVGLHPLWIIFGMLAGAALFGLVGILLAVPVTAVIGVLIRFAVEQYRASSLYNGI